MVFAATNTLLTQFADATLSGIQVTQDETTEYRLARIQLQTLSAVIAFVFLSVASILAFLVDLFSHKRTGTGQIDWRYAAIVRILAGTGFLALCGVAIFVLEQDDARTYFFLGKDLFETTLRLCDGSGGCFGGKAFMDGFDTILWLGSSFAIAGVCACAIGSALSLAKNGSADYTQDEWQHAKLYLYLSSTLLSFGILALMSWMRLPSAAIADQDSRELFMAHANAVMLYHGVSYSLVLLSYHLPTMVVLRLNGDFTATAPRAAAPTGAEPTAGIGQLRDTFYAAFALLAPVLLPLSSELGTSLFAGAGG